jgi:hypothetical protein
MRDYAVPAEVQVRMGLLPAALPEKKRHSSPSPTSAIGFTHPEASG